MLGDILASRGGPRSSDAFVRCLAQREKEVAAVVIGHRWCAHGAAARSGRLYVARSLGGPRRDTISRQGQGRARIVGDLSTIFMLSS